MNIKWIFAWVGLCSSISLSAVDVLNYSSYNTELNYQKYDVGFYFLDLKVNDTTTYLSGNVTIKATVLSESLDTLILSLSDSLTVDSVIVNDLLSEYIHQDNLLLIHLSDETGKGDIINIRVFYRGFGQEGWLGGMSNEMSSYDVRVTWTLSEPYSAKLWFPCKEDLTDKADSAYIFLTIPANRKAGSNGILTNIIPVGENEVRYEWKTRHPIDYYLISLSVADYREYSFYAKLSENNDSVFVQNYIYNSDEYYEKVVNNLNRTKDFLALFSELFGTYPYADEKYGHCTAPLGGGMEHQTMSTMGLYNFQIISHELAHQWFGDYVTCKTWQDIWVNEGFASYAEYLALEYLVSKEAADEDMEGVHEYVKMENDGSVYVPADELDDVWRIFSGRLSYKKGSSIIHMIRQEINNDELFIQVLKNYLNEYRNSVASADDFRQSLEQTTGMDFKDFFDQWFYGEGYPIFNITWQQLNDTLYISSIQTTSAPEITGLFTTKMDFKVYFYDGSDTTISFRQTANYNEFMIPMDSKVVDMEFDPGKWLLKEVESFRRILPEKLLNDMVILYPSITDKKVHVEVLDTLVGDKYIIVKNNGNVAGSGKLNSDFLEINASEYASGLYLFVVFADEGIIRKKFTVL